jgi:hypothetical protein
VAGLILENTFTSIPELVDVIFPVLRHFKALVLRINWPTVSLIPRLQHPMLFISGERDELVPRAMMVRLHNAATGAEFKDLYSVADGMHNDTFQKGGTEYCARIAAFIQRVLVARLGGAEAATRPAPPPRTRAEQAQADAEVRADTYIGPAAAEAQPEPMDVLPQPPSLS